MDFPDHGFTQITHRLHGFLCEEGRGSHGSAWMFRITDLPRFHTDYTDFYTKGDADRMDRRGCSGSQIYADFTPITRIFYAKGGADRRIGADVPDHGFAQISHRLHGFLRSHLENFYKAII